MQRVYNDKVRAKSVQIWADCVCLKFLRTLKENYTTVVYTNSSTSIYKGERLIIHWTQAKFHGTNLSKYQLVLQENIGYFSQLLIG